MSIIFILNYSCRQSFNFGCCVISENLREERQHKLSIQIISEMTFPANHITGTSKHFLMSRSIPKKPNSIGAAVIIQITSVTDNRRSIYYVCMKCVAC